MLFTCRKCGSLWLMSETKTWLLRRAMSLVERVCLSQIILEIVFNGVGSGLGTVANPQF